MLIMAYKYGHTHTDSTERKNVSYLLIILVLHSGKNT